MAFEGYCTVLMSRLGDLSDYCDWRHICEERGTMEPHSPLAAAGEAISAMTRDQLDAFYTGHLVVHVVNVATETAYTYDDATVCHELDMERLAG